MSRHWPPMQDGISEADFVASVKALGFVAVCAALRRSRRTIENAYYSIMSREG